LIDYRWWRWCWADRVVLAAVAAADAELDGCVAAMPFALALAPAAAEVWG
jgi:hypothetical protein